MNKSNKVGRLFWITGISGAGKTTLGKKIKKEIQDRYGPTVLINGDDLRNIFKLNGYSHSQRLDIGYMYSNFLKLIISQKINVIFTVVGLFDVLRRWNKKHFKNYHEIFIDDDLKKIIKNNKKKTYKYEKNVWGIDIKPQFPKKPMIKIKNNFSRNLDNLSKVLLKEIFKNIKD